MVEKPSLQRVGLDRRTLNFKSNFSRGSGRPAWVYGAMERNTRLGILLRLVRPELPTAALRSSQALAAVDNSSPLANRPESTYKSGKVVQTTWPLLTSLVKNVRHLELF